jgi:hypothetical protein
MGEMGQHAILNRRARSQSLHGVGEYAKLLANGLKMLVFKSSEVELFFLDFFLASFEKSCNLID